MDRTINPTMANACEIRPPKGPVKYDTSSMFQVLFQRVGSVWPKVLPYCVANVFLMILLTKLRQNNVADWSINGTGHTYAGMIVSFLIVSRINTAIGRYNECRDNIGIMFHATRELVENMTLFSKRNKENESDTAVKEWRNEVAYRALLLLRTTVAVVEHDSVSMPAWRVPQLSGMEKEYCKPVASWRRYQETPASDSTDAMKVPHRMAYLLRESIISQETRLKVPINAYEGKILGFVDKFLSGYHGMRKFLTTPVPFPLIQMTLTIVLGYVFTIPFVLEGDTKDLLYEHCIVVFVITFGFMGLELVSMELDDPFGADQNDFDVCAFSKVVVEDVLVHIHDIDGEVWADSLRAKMTLDAPKQEVHHEGTSLV